MILQQLILVCTYMHESAYIKFQNRMSAYLH